MRKSISVMCKSIALLLAMILLLGACASNDGAPPADTVPAGVVVPDNPPEQPQEPEAPDWRYNKDVLSTNTMLSRAVTSFDNINGKTVTVDTYLWYPNEALNNPNVGQALLLAGCIKYKQAHPDEEVYASITSFHFSVVAAVCLDKQSEKYGSMKSLYDSEYDDEGFVRIAYLVVYAAKLGIHITAIGQIDAAAVVANADGTKKADYVFEEYFASHYEDDSVIEGKKVKDFLNCQKAYWTSYGDKSASDMMHVKTCTVTNYIDPTGKECGPSFWTGSINLDGISIQGYNGNNNVQSGVVVSNHEPITRVIYNYTQLMAQYCDQEGIVAFRDLIRRMNKEQIDLINAGKEVQIAKDEQIVYLGNEQDNVFEFYFTPLGGSSGSWDPVYNPYSHYINKLLPVNSGSDYIVFIWNNVKYLDNFEFSKTMTNIIKNAFLTSGRTDNRLYLHLPRFDKEVLSELEEGKNIGIKYVNANMGLNYHTKDFQLSYVENGERQYVTVFNSLNFHQGSMSYQTNSIFVIKETAKTGNNVYVDFAKYTAMDIVTEKDRVSK